MFKSKTERLLASLLVGVLAVGLLKGLIQKKILQPLEEKRSQLANIAGELDQAEMDLRRLNAVRGELAGLKGLCLPTSVSHAKVMYQQRLVRICELAGIDDAVVSPLQNTDIGSVGQSIGFSVRSECGSEKLAQVLTLLDGDSIANRVTQVSVDRMNETRNRTAFVVEVLALNEAENPNGVAALPSLPDGGSTLRGGSTLGGGSKLRDSIVRNNPFSRGYRGPQMSARKVKQLTSSKKPALKKKKPVTVDPRKYIRLVGLVEYDGETLAWFVNSKTGKQSEYRTNDTIQVDAWSASITGFSNESLTLEFEGRMQTLQLGATVDQVVWND